jgi:hypothetical protein
MKKLLALLTLLFVLGNAGDMIVRVYVTSWQDLKRIDEKSLDIAAGRYGEWYDLVVNHTGLNKVISSGLPYEVTVHSLEYEKSRVRGTYLSYTEMNDSLNSIPYPFPLMKAGGYTA